MASKKEVKPKTRRKRIPRPRCESCGQLMPLPPSPEKIAKAKERLAKKQEQLKELQAELEAQTQKMRAMGVLEAEEAEEEED